MSPFFSPQFEDTDRYLIVDDSDDDVTQILTIACESFGSRGSAPTDGGQQ